MQKNLLIYILILLLFFGCSRDYSGISIKSSEDNLQTTNFKDSNSLVTGLKNGTESFHYYDSQDDFIFINQETNQTPVILAYKYLHFGDSDTYEELNNMDILSERLLAIANDINNAKTELKTDYSNILVVCEIPFNASIVYDYNNSTLFIPKYYEDIVYLLNTYKSDDIDTLLAIPDAKKYLYQNGFLNSNQDGLSTSSYGSLNSSYSVYISDGVFKEFSRDESTTLNYSDQTLNIQSKELPKARKSYFGEGNWLMSIDYDKFTDKPIYTISQAHSSTKDSANMWFYIRQKNNKLEVFISFSTNVTLSKDTTVTYRIDQSTPIFNEEWPLSTDKRAVFYPNVASSFITKLIEGNKLSVSIESGNKEYQVTFNMFGLKSTISPYLAEFQL